MQEEFKEKRGQRERRNYGGTTQGRKLVLPTGLPNLQAKSIKSQERPRRVKTAPNHRKATIPARDKNPKAKTIRGQDQNKTGAHLHLPLLQPERSQRHDRGGWELKLDFQQDRGGGSPRICQLHDVQFVHQLQVNDLIHHNIRQSVSPLGPCMSAAISSSCLRPPSSPESWMPRIQVCGRIGNSQYPSTSKLPVL